MCDLPAFTFWAFRWSFVCWLQDLKEQLTLEIVAEAERAEHVRARVQWLAVVCGWCAILRSPFPAAVYFMVPR